MRNHKRRFRILYLIFTLSFIGLFAISYHFFRVERVECYSQYGPCPDNIIHLLSRFVGWPLLQSLPTIQVRQNLKTFPQIKSVSLHRRLPSVLVVAINLRHPLGAIGPNVLGAQVIADDEGYIFQTMPQSTLPLLVSDVLPQLSSKLKPTELQALISLNLVGNIFDTQVYGSLVGNSLTIETPDKLQIIVDVAQSTSNWYTPLQLILHRSKINAKMPHKIDLRFSDSVITY